MSDKQGAKNDRACQLCYAEPSALIIAGIRIGERCHARALAIAADAAEPIERTVHVEQSNGVACITCGAALLVDEDALTISCPNGHAVALIPAAKEPPRRRIVVRKSLNGRLCFRCGKPIERAPGQKGVTPKYHRECRSAEELAQLEQRRAFARAYYAENRSKWTDYAERRRARLASPNDHPSASTPE